MNCDEVRRFLDAYVDGELDLIRQLDVETHLAGCPDCKKAAEQIANFSSLVRTDIEVYKLGQSEPRSWYSRMFSSQVKTSQDVSTPPGFQMYQTIQTVTVILALRFIRI